MPTAAVFLGLKIFDDTLHHHYVFQNKKIPINYDFFKKYKNLMSMKDEIINEADDIFRKIYTEPTTEEYADAWDNLLPESAKKHKCNEKCDDKNEYPIKGGCKISDIYNFIDDISEKVIIRKREYRFGVHHYDNGCKILGFVLDEHSGSWEKELPVNVFRRDLIILEQKYYKFIKKYFKINMKKNGFPCAPYNNIRFRLEYSPRVVVEDAQI